jgi:ABC-type nitrate/sulfonate/bicarbonate transport system substrate-binding protein
MARSPFTFAVFACVLLAACGQPASPPPEPAEQVTIRYTDLDNFDVRDVPLQMALDALEEQGYTVERTYLAEADLVADALARGSADLAWLNNRTTWLAIAEGAEVRTIVQAVGPTAAVAARRDLDTCAELDGQKVALTSTTGLSASLLKLYVAQRCPGTEPEYLIIGERSGRYAALLAGEIDAALVQSEDLLSFENDAPGQFHLLVQFAAEFPGIQADSLHVNLGFTRQHPQAVHDFIRALLTTHRAIKQNPQELYAEAAEWLEMDEALVESVAGMYFESNVWHANGGLTPDNIEQTLEFYTEYLELPAGLAVDDVADLSYLNAVLDEIGRQ